MMKLFYNFKDKKFIIKPIDFNMRDKKAWFSTAGNPSRKDDCFYLDTMSERDCNNFIGYVTEKDRIGVRDPELPELSKVLQYFKEWKEITKGGGRNS